MRIEEKQIKVAIRVSSDSYERVEAVGAFQLKKTNAGKPRSEFDYSVEGAKKHHESYQEKYKNEIEKHPHLQESFEFYHENVDDLPMCSVGEFTTGRISKSPSLPCVEEIKPHKEEYPSAIWVLIKLETTHKGEWFPG